MWSLEEMPIRSVESTFFVMRRVRGANILERVKGRVYSISSSCPGSGGTPQNYNKVDEAAVSLVRYHSVDN